LISAGAPPQTPLGELSALPQTPYLDLTGPTSKGREGRGWEGKEWEEGGKDGEGKEKGGGRADLLQGLRG